MLEGDLQPLVSVIISSYNHEKYIEDCLDSIFYQDYSNFEVIIRDDGSTDSTPSIIKAYLEKLNKDISIIVEYGENIGLIKSLNWLIKRSSGEIMMGCASDDIFMPGRIKNGVEIHQRYSNFDLFASDGQVISDDGELIRESFYNRKKGEDNSEIIIYKNLDYKKALNLALGGFGISYNKKILKPIGFQLPETLLYEDGFMTFLAAVQNGAVLINKSLIKYRRANTSLSRIDLKLSKDNILEQENRFLKLFYSLEETKSNYIKNNSYINNIIKEKKDNAINYLEQKKLTIKLKIDVTEGKFTWGNWLRLFFLLSKTGIDRKHVLKTLILYLFRNKFKELLIRDYEKRALIL